MEEQYFTFKKEASGEHQEVHQVTHQKRAKECVEISKSNFPKGDLKQEEDPKPKMKCLYY